MSDQANEINEVGPSSLSHIIGQAGVVAQVAVALEAAFADNKKMDDCLLVGGPGLAQREAGRLRRPVQGLVGRLMRAAKGPLTASENQPSLRR